MPRSPGWPPRRPCSSPLRRSLSCHPRCGQRARPLRTPRWRGKHRRSRGCGCSSALPQSPINSPPELRRQRPKRDALSADVSRKARASLRTGKRRERAVARSLVLLPEGCPLLAETARDVAEDVLDLVAEHDQDDDDDHRDQDENEGVLNHTLPFLTVEQFAEAQIKVGQHANSPPLRVDRTAPVSHRPELKTTDSPPKNGEDVLTPS